MDHLTQNNFFSVFLLYFLTLLKKQQTQQLANKMSLPFADLLQASNHHYEEEEESFLLQWNNHTCSMSNSFADLRDRQDFVDVTLVAGSSEFEENELEDENMCHEKSQTFAAHKVILSACSPHLKHLLRGLPKWQHPVLVFRDVPAEDLEAILTFVSYHLICRKFTYQACADNTHFLKNRLSLTMV